MNYEQLYKEALERAKEDISSGILARRETARYIFPELRESSEEMVRRTIISTLYRDDYLSTEEVNECVAWLEKQSKENMIKALRLEYEKGKADGLQEQRKEWTSEDLLNRNEIMDILQEYNRDDLIDWLEKQGNESYLQDKMESFTNAHKGEDPEGIIAACRGGEEQGEHKPVNEPKFKVGDWIMDNNGTVHHIEEIVSVNNETLYGCDDNSVLDVAFQEQYHLWTINDAKDGDVLYSPCLSLLWIFKSKDTVYCGCNLNYNDGAFCGEGYFERPTDAIPAAKEQRDLLFSKMKEAGYEWDAEKKELRKIAKFKVGDTIRLKNSLAEFTIESISNGRYYVKGSSIDIIACDHDYELAVPNLANSAKTCKDDWSEEDKKKLNRIYRLIAEAADEHAFSTTCRLIGDKECVELQDFLRSLKPQPKQEWSKEDEFCMNTILHILEQLKGQSHYEGDNTAEKCIDFLRHKLNR